MTTSFENVFTLRIIMLFYYFLGTDEKREFHYKYAENRFQLFQTLFGRQIKSLLNHNTLIWKINIKNKMFTVRNQYLEDA